MLLQPFHHHRLLLLLLELLLGILRLLLWKTSSGGCFGTPAATALLGLIVR